MINEISKEAFVMAFKSQCEIKALADMLLNDEQKKVYKESIASNFLELTKGLKEKYGLADSFLEELEDLFQSSL